MEPKPSQCAQILAILQSRGDVTNRELNCICFRFSARIYELRRRGHHIKTIHVKAGLYRFVYDGSP